MLTTIVQDLSPRTRPARLLGRTALFWLGSAVLHLAVWGIDGGAWEGAVSWRKPIVFSSSIALTSWAVGWVLDRMPVPRPRLASVLAWTFAVTASVETFLVVLQTWRGRASHFNVFDPGDATLFAIMGLIVAVMALVLVVLFAWVLREPPRDRATRWAVVGGLAAITAGLGLGQWLIDLGLTWVVATGSVPEVVMNGDAVAKFPHAVALHGIQVFALLGAVATARGLDARRRLRIVRTAVVGYVGLLAWAIVSTVAGVAPQDTRSWTAGLAIASTVLLVAAGLDSVAPRRGASTVASPT